MEYSQKHLVARVNLKRLSGKRSYSQTLRGNPHSNAEPAVLAVSDRNRNVAGRQKG